MPNQHVKFVCAVAAILAMATAKATGGNDDGSEVVNPAAPVLDWSHALRAHALVEDWVAAGSVDQPPATLQIGVLAVGGVRVTLRWSGLTMGIGDAFPASSDLTPHEVKGSVDLVPLVATATEQALRAANERLRDYRQRQMVQGSPSEANIANTLVNVGRRLQVDLQIARTARRIELSKLTALTSIERQFVPGFHGLRMTRRVGEDLTRSAWIWPASALAANISPRNQLVRLLADLDYGLDRVPFAGRTNGPQLERFEVIHVVRPGPALPVTRLVRGCSEVLISNISADYLEEMAHQLTDFLIRRQRSDGRMAGIYHPSLDRYDPVMADDQQLALAAYALGSRATALSRSGADSNQRSAAIEANQLIVDRLTRQLRRPTSDRRSPFDAAVASLLLMDLTDAPNLSPYKKDRDSLAQQLLALRQSDGAFHRRPDVASPPLDPPNQAMVIAALLNLYERTRDRQLARQLVASQEKLWQGADLNGLFKMFPWIAITELRMRRWGVFPESQEQISVRDQLLNQIIEVLHRDHVTGSPSFEQAGQHGVFAVATSPPDALGHPGWRAADLVLVQSSMMEGGQALPDHDSVQRLLACGAAVRALAQLIFTEEACYYVRSRSDVLGGVRRVFWDNRLGIEPAAMSLLALTRLQQATVAFNLEP